jgi:hypothetical protein
LSENRGLPQKKNTIRFSVPPEIKDIKDIAIRIIRIFLEAF